MGGKKPSSQHVGKVLNDYSLRSQSKCFTTFTSPDEHKDNTDDNRSHNRGNGIGMDSRELYSRPIHKRRERGSKRNPR